MTEAIGRGILPDHMLKDLVEHITRSDQIQPASFEPFVLEEAWEVKSFGNSAPSSRVDNRIKKINDIKKEELKKGKIYEIQFADKFTIPRAFFGKISPKSTIGRTGTYVETHTESGEHINETDFGYSGKLFAYVQPRSFNIVLGGTALSQIRFQTIDAKVTEKEIREIWLDTPLLRDLGYDISIPLKGIEFDKDGLVLHADTTEVYVPKQNDSAVNLDKQNLSSGFWETTKRSKSIVAKQGVCHILGSLEGMVTPNYLASELREYSQNHMSLHQAHIAGFIDPGFGNPYGNSLTFEFTSFSPLTIRHNKPLGVIDYYRMFSEPKKPYSGNYITSKGVRLAKCFVDDLEQDNKQETLNLDK